MPRHPHDQDEPTQPEAPKPAAPWEPILFETAQEHDKFQAWLASGLPVCTWARQQGLNPSTVQALSGKNRWIVRRDAHSAHLRAIALTAAEHEARDRGLNLARILDLGEELILASFERAMTTGEFLKPRELAPLIKNMADLRALQAGRATSRVDISGLSPKAIAALDAAIFGEDPPEDAESPDPVDAESGPC